MKILGGGELLSKYFAKTPFEATHICDATYGLPKRDYVVSNLLPQFKKRLEKLGLSKWESSSDCFLPNTPLIIKENDVVKLIEIQELPEYPVDTFILDDAGWTKINWVKRKYSDKDTSVLFGKNGFLEVTADHPIFTSGEYKPISEVVDMSTISGLNISGDIFNKTDINITTEEAFMLGVFMAEGTCNSYIRGDKHNKIVKQRSWHIDMGELDVLMRILPALELFTNMSFKVVLYNSHRKGVTRGGCTSTKHLYRLLADKNKYGDRDKLVNRFRKMFYTSSGDKKVPDFMFSLSIEHQRCFIDGFLAGDGYKTKSNIWQAASKSRIGAYGVQIISKLAGIDCVFRYDNRSYGRRSTCPVLNFKYDKSINSKRDHVKVIEKRGMQLVYDLNTDSGHLYAGGYLVHNCDNFAWRLWDYAQWANYLSFKDAPSDKHPEGMALGVIYYITGGTANKAVAHYKENLPDYWKAITLGTPIESDILKARADRNIPRGGGHAINCVVMDDDTLEFIEPQTYSIVPLTPAERNSIWFVHF